MQKKRGIWVFRTGAPLKARGVEETAQSVRKEREQEVAARKRNPRNKAQ